MLVLSDSLVLSEADAALPEGTPLILWDNRVTISNVTASNADASYPAVNLANPATNQEWRAEAGHENTVIEATLNTMDEIDGVGIARHNFGSEGVAVSIEVQDDTADPYEKVLLHFDGADTSTTITDSNTGGSAHSWTATGNAHIDTAAAKFGGSSLHCDGTGDYLSTPDHADFALGSGDFTIDFWFNCNAAGGTEKDIAGQCDNAATGTTLSFIFARTTANVIVSRVNVGASAFVISGATQFTNAVNTGWHHVAMVRTSDVLKLFIDGGQEGGDLAIAGTINNSSSNLTVGALGEYTGATWTGWIDEFRLSVGIARWTSNFTPPSSPNHSNLLAGPQVPPTDQPLLFWFTPQPVSKIRVVLNYESGVVPRAAVLYVGPLLVAERGFDVGTDFTPPLFARKTQSVNGMSHAGDFLGRIITSQAIEGSVAIWKHFTPDWYRDEFDPFVAAAQRDTPFFFAWLPDTYPYEIAFCWLADDPYPVVSPITQRMHVSLKLDGIVE